MSTIKKALVFMFAGVILFTLASCGGSLDAPRNGTYKSDGLLSQTWIFSGDNEITLSTVGGLVSTSGTYTISGDRLTITSSLLGVESTSGYKITEITRDSFFIDGTKFVKQ